jgi:hypothetical protein
VRKQAQGEGGEGAGAEKGSREPEGGRRAREAESSPQARAVGDFTRGQPAQPLGSTNYSLGLAPSAKANAALEMFLEQG